MSSFTTDSASTSPDHSSESLADLKSKLQSESPKSQLQLVQSMAEQAGGYAALLDVLTERRDQSVGIVEGKIYQILAQSNDPAIQSALETHWPQQLVSTPSEREIDYDLLQRQLVTGDYEAADRTTLQKLCELAGETAVQRKWLYFTEVNGFPVTDLQTLDTLWQVYSEGKFGYSVQRQLWLGVGKNWEKLWPKIDWKSGNNWTRYPGGFTWNLSAPVGHLPLSNQLRGVRVIEALLTHPAWTTESR